MDRFAALDEILTFHIHYEKLEHQSERSRLLHVLLGGNLLKLDRHLCSSGGGHGHPASSLFKQSSPAHTCLSLQEGEPISFIDT